MYAGITSTFRDDTASPPDWVESRPYQQDAIRSWFEADGQGILHMATGTGKTITALLTASQVAESFDGKFVLVVAVPYQHLVDQWADDLREFVREYFEGHENERIAAAVALYERERITLGDAARLADVDRWTRRGILREHGVELRLVLVGEDDATYEVEAPSEQVSCEP
jgi:superfamily II DNA or RNA helicase